MERYNIIQTKQASFNVMNALDAYERAVKRGMIQVQHYFLVSIMCSILAILLASGIRAWPGRGTAGGE